MSEDSPDEDTPECQRNRFAVCHFEEGYSEPVTTIHFRSIKKDSLIMPAEPRKANLLESMGLGGTSAVFAVNFTHPIVRFSVFLVKSLFSSQYCCILLTSLDVSS